MKIKLINDWGGAVKGTALEICKEVGEDLIKRGIAKEDNQKNSAPKGAGNGGKDGKK